MKILQLRFKNLNSLAGEWSIDFTAPEYISDGIFAISGPTGAGKSTIMDAICLALYGRTPRLKGISKNSNEIMSRHTGECFAEVVFETQKGRFRCTWRQHRARRKPNEELQNPSHEIADLPSGNIIESKIRSVAIAIEERTGMDFDRFTQSMLLAQGGFAAFLQADPNERAPILEQITGTGIYSKISIDVYERRRAENNKLDLLKAKTDGFAVLNPQEESILIQQLADIQKVESELTKKKAEIDQSIIWLNGIDQLKEELVEIKREASDHLLTLQNFEPERRILDKALKGVSLEGDYATLTAKRKLQTVELEVLSRSEQKMPELSNNLGSAQKQHSEVCNTLNLNRKQTDAELVKIKWVRALDITINEKESVLTKSIAEHNGYLSDKIAKIRDKKVLQNESLEAKNKLEKVENYLKANSADAVLITELTGIKEKLKNLQEAKSISSKLESQVKDLEKIHIKWADQVNIQMESFQSQKKKHNDLQEKVIHCQQALRQLLGERQLREYRSDLAHLNNELIYLRKIVLLENERKLLADNHPCPLCGSLDHPFAAGNIPEQDETQRKTNELTTLIEQADLLEATLKRIETDEKGVLMELNTADKQLQQAQNNIETSQINLTNRMQEKTHARENFTRLLSEISLLLQTFGYSGNESVNPEEIFQSLNGRVLSWQKNQQEKGTIEGEINRLSSQIENINVLIGRLGDTLKLKLKAINTSRSELEEIRSQRTSIYGIKDPEEEERHLLRVISEAEKSERIASDQKNRLFQELEGLKTRINELKSSTLSRNIELKADEASFLVTLQSLGFDDEKNFLEYRLTVEQRDKLGRQATMLDTKQADIVSRKKEREERLTNETAKRMTEIPLAELTEQQQLTGNSLSSVLQEIGARQQKLSDNIIARKNLGEIMLQIEARKSEFKRWDMLYNLIGSADGKKYRNFAQGLTFEIMVAHANLQLMKLTDRYLLIRDKDQPLDLNVVDNYQAGEVRSTKNLSGGESFIVSLALALGLSRMASRNVRVDSLFLDEGFGSLDEDTLETALETLASLRQDGKLIGVISHVSALKERITTKIIVQKVSGGKSIITGPGCSRNY